VAVASHADTSTTKAYSMLLRARTQSRAPRCEPAAAVAVIGRGEVGLPVKTVDDVCEPQNFCDELVIQ